MRKLRYRSDVPGRKADSKWTASDSSPLLPLTPVVPSLLHAVPPDVQRRQAVVRTPHHRPPRHRGLLRPRPPVHVRLLARRGRRGRRVRRRRRLRLRPSPHSDLPHHPAAPDMGSQQRRSRRSRPRPLPAISPRSIPAQPRRIAPLDGLPEPRRRPVPDAQDGSPVRLDRTDNSNGALHRRELSNQLARGTCLAHAGRAREGQGSPAIHGEVNELSERCRLGLDQVSHPLHLSNVLENLEGRVPPPRPFACSTFLVGSSFCSLSPLLSYVRIASPG
ncbi:hypothetical protein OH76DRAFT_548697 [Lentinus brumalis]|uniref:Uncharacterized protein n=1 Tax=Lentinus brumalis TaxID=2498619 RepID=A0A371D9W7_9APHY|nr:hypothetical protein OH76DRAFT_548697 [Polyporus brumalis]